MRQDMWLAAIAGHHNHGIEWDSCQHRHLVAFGQLIRATPLEDIGLLAAVRADKATHILDQSDHRPLQLATETE